MRFKTFIEAAKFAEFPQSDVFSDKRKDGEWYRCDPRKLTRAKRIPSNRRREHDGPVEGGIFYALADANDMHSGHGPFVHADTAYLLRTGDLYMKDVRSNDPAAWQKVESLDQINFKMSLCDDYEGCTVNVDVRPFMPEFYYVPRNAKGRRVARRAASWG